MHKKLQELKEHAGLAGATAAAILSAGDIVVEDQLAERCRTPRCANYGLSKSCPPHVAGPTGLRELLQGYEKALFFRIDVPPQCLYSSESREVFQLLHEVAAGIEQCAVRLGMFRAFAFAGDSCKRIFCGEYPSCQALSTIGKCRHLQSARPSMSGFGINVQKLLAAAGWDCTLADGGPDKAVFVCGLVLLY